MGVMNNLDTTNKPSLLPFQVRHLQTFRTHIYKYIPTYDIQTIRKAHSTEIYTYLASDPQENKQGQALPKPKSRNTTS